MATLVTLGGAGGGKPYTTNAEIECTSCHNVHFEGVWAANSTKRPFLRTAGATVSDFCAECHADRLNSATVGTGNASGNHPVKIAYTDSAATGSGAITLKAAPDALLTNLVGVAPTVNWSLGGKFEGNLVAAPTAASLVGCHTCHAVHNPAAGADQGNHLLAISNNAATAALCEGCHGNAAGNAARANSGATYMVGGATGDHPIDVTIAAPGPVIDRWYLDGSTTRSERHAAASKEWPQGTGGNIVCVSCHSAHRAQANLKLLRTGSANTFCTACHADASPAGHHTHSANTGARVGEAFVSGLDCTDCHGAGLGTFAHNGFNFNTFTGSNDGSQLCFGCHGGAAGLDPIYSTPPVDHLGFAGVAATKTSHYIGVFANAVNAINVKTGLWLNGYSKYGGNGVDTHNSVAPTVNASSTLVCESCHSVLHNTGAGATATAVSGWKANLLLQNYADDSNAAGTAIQSALCVACHNNNQNAGGMGSSAGLADWSAVNTSAVVPPGTHPMTGWNITRAVDAGRATTTLITGAGTYADAAGAPNTASYYGVNAMDCDSCHRPHYAPANSTYNQTRAGGAGAARNVILEKQAVANEWADLCQECHNM
jgi:predicted CXXCH cytochrome family protein